MLLQLVRIERQWILLWKTYKTNVNHMRGFPTEPLHCTARQPQPINSMTVDRRMFAAMAPAQRVPGRPDGYSDTQRAFEKPEGIRSPAGSNRSSTAQVNPAGISQPGPTFQTRPVTGGQESSLVCLWSERNANRDSFALFIALLYGKKSRRRSVCLLLRLSCLRH